MYVLHEDKYMEIISKRFICFDDIRMIEIP